MRILSTIRKAGRVIGLFTPDHPEWGVSEVAAALAMSKSAAHAVLASLAEAGFLRRTGTGRYRLGWRLIDLGQVLSETTLFRVEAVPVMENLVARYGETVHLGVLEDGEVVYVEKREGTRAVRIDISRAGKRLPAHCTAIGKLLLAHRPWDEVERIIQSRGLPALTHNTITTMGALQAELARVRRQGYSVDHEEVLLELCSVAAPLRDYTGAVVAAISLAVPSYRFRQYEGEYRQAVLEAADRISASLGYTQGARPEGTPFKFPNKRRARSLEISRNASVGRISGDH